MSMLINASEAEQRATLLGHGLEPTEDENDENDGNDGDPRETSVHDTLLLADDDDEDDDDDNNHEASVGLAFLLILTCGVAGLQVVWSVLLSNGSQFLVSLGLSKSLTALVWIAAPLCGVVIQPLAGVLSDRSQSRWGQRRPFIVVGAMGITVSMLALSWVQEVIHAFIKMFRGDPQSSASRSLVVVIAVFWIYALNISIQPLQGGIRAFIVENCPAHQQSQASAWASRMVGFGNLVGYISGFSALPRMFLFTGMTQFQALCLIASLSVTITVILSCSWITEQSPRRTLPVSQKHPGLVEISRDLIRTYRHMPVKIQKVCHVQFCAWMGWFPFLFYSTTYVGEHYKDPAAARDSSAGPHPLSPDAIRIGTSANLLFAIVALVTNIGLPLLVRDSKKDYDTWLERRLSSRGLSRFVNYPRLGIPRAWTCAHILYALTMFTTFFVTSQVGATILIGIAGLSWAFMLWAPFAIIGEEISTRHLSVRADGDRSAETGAGAIVGIHNIATSLPQIIAAVICSGIFWLAQAVGSDDGTAWVLRAGGCAALGAAYLTSKLKD